MKEFLDSSPLFDDREALAARLSEHSYLFFRGLVDPKAILEVRRDVTAMLASIGWLAPNTDPMDGIPSAAAVGEGDAPEWIPMYTEFQRIQRFHELAHDPGLLNMATTVLGEEALVHPRQIGRVSLPGPAHAVSAPHQDFPLVQGTADTLTAWVPLGDCPNELGGLRILSGSHRRGLVRPVPKDGGGFTFPDVDDDDPAWASIDYECGDALVFHSLSIHAGKPNPSNRLRISADFRYQAVSEPVVEGSMEVHYFPAVPSYAELSSGWTSTAGISTSVDARVVAASNGRRR